MQKEVAETVVLLKDVIDQPEFHELHRIHLQMKAFVFVGLLQLEDAFDHRFVNLLVLGELWIARGGHDVFFVPEMHLGIDDQLIQNFCDIVLRMFFHPAGMKFVD